jgi:hypothetical protein
MNPSVNQKPFKLVTERELLTVQPLPITRYENEQLAALTVYSIWWLRHWSLRPTVESITVLNHKLFPEKFGMDSFPEYPDANRTLRSLLQCGPKYRGWLSGSNKRGYVITPNGQTLVEELLRRIGYPKVGNVELGHASEAPRARATFRKKTARDVDFKAEVQKLRDSKLFDRWSNGPLQERDLIHLYSAFGVFDHTPVVAKAKKLSDLRHSAKRVADVEVEKMLDAVEDMFPTLFKQTDRTKSRR